MIAFKAMGVPISCGTLLIAASAATLSGQSPAENLHVLPADIPRRELNRVMLSNLQGLGLPRRENRGCLFCHVGDMDVPRSDWDYASDDKLTKRKARTMMAMVQEINTRLEDLEGRLAPDLRVTCYTCHAGRTDPRPLPDLLMAAYRAGGVDSLAIRYRTLRERYFGGDAYDFRFNLLPSIAGTVIGEGAFDDALAISSLNEEVFAEEPAARAFTVTIRIRRAMGEEGIEAGFGVFDNARVTEPETVVTWAILDNLGWGYSRSDRAEDALQIFRKNLETFPDDYVPNESLSYGLSSSGELERGISLMEDWVEGHPNDDVARRHLESLRSRR